MRRLTILYDETCGFCVRVRDWMKRQPAFVELEFFAIGGADVQRLYPDLRPDRSQFTIIDDGGGVYRGTDAYLLALWALEEWRGLAMDLASPALRPLARRAFAVLSGSRRGISWLFRLTPETLKTDEVPAAEPTGPTRRLLAQVQDLRRQ